MAKLVAASSLGSLPDTYFYSVAQIAAGALAVIGSDDTLRFFDLSPLETTHVFTACHKGIECLEKGSNQTVYTAGRDGIVRGWDTRSKTAAVLEVKEPKGAGISALASQDFYLAAGTESTKEGLGDVSVHVFDVRKPASALRTYGDSHTDTITNVRWHPSQRNLLLTGSTDGLVSIFDADQVDEEDAIQQVLNPRSAVHCSGFIAADQAYVLSTDEQFTIYGLNKTGTADEEALPVAEFGDVRPKLDCMYVVDIVQNQFTSSLMLAYGHNEKKKLGLTLLNSPDYSFGQSIDLPGAHGEEVARDIRFVSETQLISCGEDGHVRLWDLHSLSATDMDIDETPKSSKKKSRKEKKHADRFTPY